MIFVFPVLAVLGPGMCPDRPNLKRYFISDPNFAVATHPGPFRATFGLKPIFVGQLFVDLSYLNFIIIFFCCNMFKMVQGPFWPKTRQKYVF